MALILNWISRIITAILVLILIAMAYMAVSAKITGGKPNVFGYQLLTVLSGSMEPKIKTGSIIAVQPVTDPTTLKEGDVITFKSEEDPNMLITHRIMKVIGSGKNANYFTKGDNNEFPDSQPVLAANVVAKYSNITIPNVGYVMEFVKSKKGLMLLLVLPGVLIILYQFYNLWSLITRMSEENDSSVKMQDSQNV